MATSPQGAYAALSARAMMCGDMTPPTAADRRASEGPRPATGGELQAVLRAEREGAPFFVYRDEAGELRVVRFEAPHTQLTFGRNATADVSIAWDDQVSSLHAVVQLLAGELTILDDGLSRNGSYVNGERVRGMRRLRDRDLLRLGSTLVTVRIPADAERSATAAFPQPLLVSALSEQQRRVLALLCRPAREGVVPATPPTNHEIAAELHLSVAAVKMHLRALFDKFAVAELPQNKKRVALAQRAMQAGVISERDCAAE